VGMLRPMLQGLRVAAATPPPVVARPASTELPAAQVSLVAPSCASLCDWLFSGALAHASGAIAGWRDRATGRLSDEYPEITGYFDTATCRHSMRLRDRRSAAPRPGRPWDDFTS